MIYHHPDENLLAEYASGSLAWALSLSVCAHVQMCPHCRQKITNLNKIGGAILNASHAEACGAKDFENLMQRIHQSSAIEQKSSAIEQKSLAAEQQPPAAMKPPAVALDLNVNNYRATSLLNDLPPVVKKLLPVKGALKWQRVSSALSTAYLIAGQNEYEIAFQRISRGGKVVEHDHRGLEITLVLQGSFSDEQGVYSEGDFLIRNPGDIHRPTATLHQDCLCLSVVAAPVKLTGFFGYFINPFLSIKPA
jgi:putative transcriptional regulator